MASHLVQSKHRVLPRGILLLPSLELDLAIADTSDLRI